ncbi:MAG: hypothetical protein RR244_07840 [Oscillospiraceae bacterium]
MKIAISLCRNVSGSVCPLEVWMCGCISRANRAGTATVLIGWL